MQVRRAACADTAPDVLRMLAEDERITVRAAVALNPAAPDVVDAILAQDGDDRVRTLLARKIAALIPSLSRRGRLRLQDQAMQTLMGLVESEAERVRLAIADVVKDMPEAPRELILRLAHDTAVPVSEPVLRLSPVLTTADLLTLLARPPTAVAATAIARRPGLPAEVAEAIASGDDSAAIHALLANHSANLREAALDALVGRARAEETWHDPLVHRPALSGKAATALSDFVTTHLLTVLASRADLDPTVAASLRQRLDARLSDGSAGQRLDDPALEDAMQLALGMRREGKLDDEAVLAATQRGAVRMCTAMLAAAADVPSATVERAATLRNAKGLVSLVWKAGFGVHLSPPLQMLVGRVPPHAVLRSANGRDFPLAAEEMQFQVDLLRRMGR